MTYRESTGVGIKVSFLKMKTVFLDIFEFSKSKFTEKSLRVVEFKKQLFKNTYIRYRKLVEDIHLAYRMMIVYSC